MRKLYTGSPVNSTGYLKVSDLHSIYYEECGKVDGLPVVFLHGGPGGGIEEAYRGFFDPQRWRSVLFDQRGCGRSRPFSELRENTTWDLVADIEKLREHLGVEKWHVFGGSWGSTLALAYATRHPERVAGLLLRGIFLLRSQEIRWFYQFGASEIFPDEFDHYVAPIPEEERVDLVKAFYKRLTSDSKEVRAVAAKAWSVWEAATSKLLPDAGLRADFGRGEFADAFARIECHYFMNKGFFEEEDELLQKIDAIRHIPAVIVQGRYDVVCPMRSAWDLHKCWPEAKFQIVADAGHSSMDPGIRTALLNATDEFAERFGQGG